jgi:hypothetical protein
VVFVAPNSSVSAFLSQPFLLLLERPCGLFRTLDPRGQADQ